MDIGDHVAVVIFALLGAIILLGALIIGLGILLVAALANAVTT